MATVTVLNAGMYTLIQDCGRFGVSDVGLSKVARRICIAIVGQIIC